MTPRPHLVADLGRGVLLLADGRAVLPPEALELHYLADVILEVVEPADLDVARVQPLQQERTVVRGSRQAARDRVGRDFAVVVRESKRRGQDECRNRGD